MRCALCVTAVLRGAGAHILELDKAPRQVGRREAQREVELQVVCRVARAPFGQRVYTGSAVRNNWCGAERAHLRSPPSCSAVPCLSAAAKQALSGRRGRL
jgi:hypothetical protein